ncbi:Epimerase family protein [invertebrate metagenome]|uniref:Epimerase family protein n=1 Tax=invertebrate metagenome TaxID=1711999 RepID=A0A2H9T503_9ZZZZ
MHILITGGTGFIGQALVNTLLALNHQVTIISRQNPDAVKALFVHPYDRPAVLNQKLLVSSLSAMDTQCHYDVVVNLAGEGIMDKRWTDQRKQILSDSRIALTTQLISRLKQLPTPPNVFVSASAIGFYGSQPGNAVLTESSPAGRDFPAHLCAQWEQAAQQAESLEPMRICILRIGVVLHPSGGALKKMLPAFRIGLGGPLGNGQQIMPWIHRDDVVSALLFLISHHISGIFNATAPYPVTNREFTKTLGRTLNRPAFFRVPKSLLKLGLGEASVLLTGGQSVIPKRLQQEGFTFSFPLLPEALNHLLKQG